MPTDPYTFEPPVGTADPSGDEELKDSLLAEWKAEHGFGPKPGAFTELPYDQGGPGMGESLALRSGDPRNAAVPATPAIPDERALPIGSPVDNPAPSSTAAIQYQGQQEYNALRAGGATHAEALRLTAHKIFATDPNEAYIKSTLREPLAADAKGLFMSRAGTSFYRPDGGDTSQPPPVPPVAADQWPGLKPGMVPMAPSETPEQIQARQMAAMDPLQLAKFTSQTRRNTATQAVQAKIAAGSDPMEALRSEAHNLFPDNPEHVAALLKATKPEAMKEEKPSEAAKAAQVVFRTRIGQAQRELTAALKKSIDNPKDAQASVDAENARTNLQKAEEDYQKGAELLTPSKASTPPRPAAPAAPEKAAPMPTDKAKLVKGQRYVTERGEATWDGTKFVK